MVLYLFLNQSCQFICGLRPPLLQPNGNPAIPARDPTARRHSDPTLTLYPTPSIPSLQPDLSPMSKTQKNSTMYAVNQQKPNLQIVFSDAREDQKHAPQHRVFTSLY
ncbi:uncharacterized protein APUU_12162S [Aspergillus puulaauensis]|uniref:Uncharacterized protein n=1 Tax=Aspergillus puulaauensis TaxID=1220207 RepID=A0A7R7XEQ2_9EURO|nr:uncharacterized protein APUU_12162S [Aspergillus puulaauensis]BCS19334.1 hypothetical protein APUU_12162S [Aspergillus puulaauensis]